MKEFIQDFAKGKIQIKYHLVNAKFSKKKRRLISVLTFLISLFLIGFSAKYYDHIGGNSKWPLIVLTILILMLPAYIIGKRILQYKIIGEILFFDEYLEIQKNKEVSSLNYSEIVRIEYSGELPSDLLQTNVHSFKTYRVKFFTGIKEYFIIHITKDIFILPEEKEHFRKIHPILPLTLKEIKPRYGILEDS